MNQTDPTILIKKEYTRRDIAKANEAGGKSYGSLAGSWVHDLCALRKVITLCPFCTHKFNPNRLGYIRDRDMPIVQAKCDGCETFDARCTAYFFEETYKTVRSTAADRRAEQTAYEKRKAHILKNS